MLRTYCSNTWGLVDLGRSTLGDRSVATYPSPKSCEVDWGRSTSLLKDSIDLTAPTGVVVSTTFTVWKVNFCWGYSKVLAKSRASSLLKLTDHFLSSASILLSADLKGLMSLNLAGLLPYNLVDLAGEAAFFLLFSFVTTLLPGDFTVPWPSTTPTGNTKAGSTREELVSVTVAAIDLSSLSSLS